MQSVSRRSVLQGTGLAALAVLLPAELLAGCTRSPSTTAAPGGGATTLVGTHHGGFLVFDAHEAAVVVEATARLIPGPLDDPAEAGHPGAREANVVRYIDTMLGALTLSPQAIFAGGPFSNRAGSSTDDMAHFIGLGPAEATAWKARTAAWRAAYERGIAALDKGVGGDFTTATKERRDAVLAKDPGGFTTLLFGHAIEAMYSPPEYGGNADLVGWNDIGFPGDVQPRGYTAAEVTDSDGPDVYVPDATAAQLLSLIATSNEK
ncbi:MAG: gluconate 2-dehydrogenase subunit 3 family protein [Acidimicrobiales bacterium]